MAASSDSGDSVGSWPGFVAQLNSTFNLLRDVFGYAMPGGVFIATGLLSKRFSLADVDNLLRPYRRRTCRSPWRNGRYGREAGFGAGS